MLLDCRFCGNLSELALITDHQSQIKCVKCGQEVTRNTREGAVIAWNVEQEKPLWSAETEEAFNKVMLGGAEDA